MSDGQSMAKDIFFGIAALGRGRHYNIEMAVAMKGKLQR